VNGPRARQERRALPAVPSADRSIISVINGVSLAAISQKSAQKLNFAIAAAQLVIGSYSESLSTGHASTGEPACRTASLSDLCPMACACAEGLARAAKPVHVNAARA
jgi:hypothetical protein